MEHESFENEEIAELINDNFVPIKVDREERPDVDLTYMTYVQAATGHGGWPMSVFLTPELKPFYGGTYYPPENTPGRMGFKKVLTELAKVWKEDRKSINERAASAVEKLQEHLDGERHSPQETSDRGGSAKGVRRPFGFVRLSRGRLWQCAEVSAADFAATCSSACASRLSRTKNKERVRLGSGDGGEDTARHGQWRHAGSPRRRLPPLLGGWLLAHPALRKDALRSGAALTAYTEGHQLTDSVFLADIAREIGSYVKRDLRHPEGGFFSAEDADSYIDDTKTKKSEGWFYVWKASEIDELLGKEEGSIFRYAYGARRDGNARPESDPHGELKGLNTLFRAMSVKKTAEYFKLTPEQVEAIFEKGRKILFEARAKRPRPHLDDKIITAWNGLMISGLARAGAALGEKENIELAAQAAQFLHDKLCAKPGNGLLRSWREGDGSVKAFAMDYACLVHGLIDLYQAGFDVQWLRWAEQLQNEMDSLFLDKEHGGYYSVHTDMPNSVLRIKEDYDGAEPSPNSLAALNLTRLSAALGKEEWREQAAKIFRLFGSTLEKSTTSVPAMVMALEFFHRGKQQIVLAGDKSSAEFAALAKTVHGRLLPHAIILHADGAEAQQYLGKNNEALRNMAPLNGKPAAYVCENFVCQAPVTEPAALEKLL